MGRILWTDDVAALDEYEGVDTGLYLRVSVPGSAGPLVETYVGKSAASAWPTR